MSSPKVRSILLLVALLLVLPVAGEAAGLAPAAPGESVWTMFWGWLSQLWRSESLLLEPATGMTSFGAAASTGSTTTSGTSNGATCGGDQGVCIDPNG